MTEYRPDGRQKTTQPNQPRPLSPAENLAAVFARREKDKARQAKHRAKLKPKK